MSSRHKDRTCCCPNRTRPACKPAHPTPPSAGSAHPHLYVGVILSQLLLDLLQLGLVAASHRPANLALCAEEQTAARGEKSSSTTTSGGEPCSVHTAHCMPQLQAARATQEACLMRLRRPAALLVVVRHHPPAPPPQPRKTAAAEIHLIVLHQVLAHQTACEA